MCSLMLADHLAYTSVSDEDEPPPTVTDETSFSSLPSSPSAVGPALDQAAVARPPKVANYGFFALLVAGFFWVSGGCYGNEELFTMGPPALVLPCLVVIPVLFSIPTALITTELTSAMPYDGGVVSWVHEAFGSGVSGHNAYWIFTAFAVDAAIYPVLAGDYVSQSLNHTAFLQNTGKTVMTAMVGSAMIIFVLIVKLMGTNVLVRFNGLLIAVSQLPAVIYVCWSLPKWNTSVWFATRPGEVNLSALVAWQIWLYSGFASLGSLAAEVDNPRKTLPRVTFTLVPLATAVNIIPLLAALSLNHNYAEFYVGEFEHQASQMGKWLGVWMTVAVQLVSLGLHNGSTMVAERSAAQFFTSRFPSLRFENNRGSSPVWRWLVDDRYYGVGPIFIFGTVVVDLLLCWIPYDLLVQTSVLLSTSSFLMLYICFVYFRFKWPDMPRPFALPGNKWAAIGWAFIPFTFALSYWCIALTDQETSVIAGHVFSHVKLYVFFTVAGVGFVAHAITYLYKRWCAKPHVERDEARVTLTSINSAEEDGPTTRVVTIMPELPHTPLIRRDSMRKKDPIPLIESTVEFQEPDSQA